MGPLAATRHLRTESSRNEALTICDAPLRSAPVRRFWIGPLKVDPPILQAPMAGYTNYAFRQIVREFGGAGLLATEMVNAKGFVWLAEQEAEHPDRLWGVKEEPRPLAVQIWDNDPATLAKVGARLAHEYQVSVVDINFGCPVRDVVQKAHSGSYLLREPERMGAIIEQVVAACAPTPVTAKIRLGCTRDQINAIDIAQVVEGAGAAALTVHGRTAADMFRGSADWDRIAAIKPHLKTNPADRQRRSRLAAKSGRCVSPLRHRRRDDRPRVAGQAVAVPPGGRGTARRAGSARSDARGRAAAAAAPFRPRLPAIRRSERLAADAQVRLLLRPRPPRVPASSAAGW